MNCEIFYEKNKNLSSMKKKISILLSELSEIFENSLSLLKYPRKRIKTHLSFLKDGDSTVRMYFVNVYQKKKYAYVIYDSTVFCYAFSDFDLPLTKRITVWGRFYRKKWFYIEKWEYLDPKKFCYEFF